MQISLLRFIDSRYTLYVYFSGLYVCQWTLSLGLLNQEAFVELSCDLTQVCISGSSVFCPCRLWSGWVSSVLISSEHLDFFRSCYLCVFQSICCLNNYQALLKQCFNPCIYRKQCMDLTGSLNAISLWIRSCLEEEESARSYEDPLLFGAEWWTWARPG